MSPSDPTSPDPVSSAPASSAAGPSASSHPRLPGASQLSRLAVRDRRERVIAALSDHFAADLLSVEEFERRVTAAHQADSLDDLDTLLADLAPTDLRPTRPEPTLPARRPTAATETTTLAIASDAPDERRLVAIFGGVDRRGSWTVPRKLRVVTVMGGAHLDLREAHFPPGPVDVEVFAMMGGVEILVPPGLPVETHGTAVMGGFAQLDRAPADLDPSAPRLRVHGFVMMGGVDVKTGVAGGLDRRRK